MTGIEIFCSELLDNIDYLVVVFGGEVDTNSSYDDIGNIYYSVPLLEEKPDSLEKLCGGELFAQKAAIMLSTKMHPNLIVSFFVNFYSSFLKEKMS